MIWINVYDYYKNKNKDKDKQIYYLCDGDGVVHNSGDIVNKLDEKFSGFDKDKCKELNYKDVNDLEMKKEDINVEKRNECEWYIKKNEIINEIKRMKRNVTLGYNGIPTVYVKNFMDVFGELFYYIMNYIIFMGYIPAKLNIKYLYPVYKMNNKEDSVDGYRDVYFFFFLRHSQQVFQVKYKLVHIRIKIYLYHPQWDMIV